MRSHARSVHCASVRSRKSPTDDDVLRAARSVVTESHYGFAPGLASCAGVYSALCIAGFKRGDATRKATGAALARLARAGEVEPVELTGPGGIVDRDWYKVS